jgi:aspartate ammonia-lyase
MRLEKDHLGERQVPEEAFYGIHSLRARENFPDQTRFHQEWFKALALVKLACYQTYDKLKQAIGKKYPGREVPLRLMDQGILESLIRSAEELSEGSHFESFIVPAMQGGAGTSINMNINEILANVALRRMGSSPGNYTHIDPIEHANVYQSTNDVVPTALKVAAMKLLEELEDQINRLRGSLEKLEQRHRDDLRMGYTQLQEAVPSSFGKLFSAYNEALSRDWWRVSRCQERLKVVNLGGSAIGTGLTVPTYFIMEVVPVLRRLTNLPVARAENMPDATSNLDPFVEVHATLKAHAVNLEKMVSDIRLLSSDLAGTKELELPGRQVGSSIMPGKINPVIPEFVIGAVHKIYSNDSLISSLAGQGNLELNPHLPAIGHAFLESLKLLIASNQTLMDNMIGQLSVHSGAALRRMYHSPAVTTALSPYIGYNKASEMARIMKDQQVDVFEANRRLKYLDESRLACLMEPASLLKMGFQMDDLLQDDNSPGNTG